ncbi:hypothetical protein AwDysgo_00850 [Bacteroidales bacterium]|nr:hypothetical protein AwDysgo_00850 [Bacteroidales bacterium]
MIKLTNCIRLNIVGDELVGVYNKQVIGRENALTTPAKKTKIYAYLEALLGESKSQKELIKERKRDYLNAYFWNLESPYLSGLKTFLKPNL